MKAAKYDRSFFYKVQTLQPFLSDHILEASRQLGEPFFTDDASMAEKKGFKIHMVEGNTTNINITTPSDLPIAETFIKMKDNNLL